MSTTTHSGYSQAFNPKTSPLHEATQDIMQSAGIQIGGPDPWDMRINAPGVPERAFAQHNLGLGEAYMDGHWDADQLDEFFARLLSTRLTDKIKPMRLMLYALSARFLNRQNRDRAWQVGEQHYDLGNEFYAAMLDERMTYTCGYWENATTLAEAQEAKLDLVCRKLKLEPGMRVLDIGCGWGSFMGYAAEHYGVECVGVSISKEQVEWAQQRYAGLPLEFRLQDYRDLNEKFDAIASIGMFEHVGRKNHRHYMEVAHRCLDDHGLFLLHTIGKNERKTVPDAWIDKYIFPNGDLPSAGQIADAADGLFVVEDLHNFGPDYDKTLMAWHDNFMRAWPRFSAQLGDRFYRMWRYYLLSCAGAFRARDIQLWQWVLSRHGVPGGYHREQI
jgi:cyclopropane-fatty-acyl-phospholipid synthase